MNSTRRHILSSSATALALAITAALHTPAHGQIIQRWLTQWGSSANDRGFGVAVDGAGTTWVTGHTVGDLGGPSAGGYDLFLTPLSATGVRGTSVQRGGTATEGGFAVAVVGGSTVFAVGSTTSPLWDGAAVVGGEDAVAVRYSTAGTYQSTTRFGSTGSDVALAAAGNATHLLVSGETTGTIDGQAPFGGKDAFLSKRTSTGALVWTRCVGTVGTAATEIGRATAFDSAGNAYLAGTTLGSLPTFTSAGSSDIFVARYDANGTQTLLKQWGSSGSDGAQDMAVDGSGNLYFTGSTYGDLGGQANSGLYDAFLTKLDPSGNVLWTRLLGGTDEDEAYDLALDAAGHVWIGGYSASSFAGHTNAGGHDAFVAQYDSAGNLLNTRFWGGSSLDEIWGLAEAPDGSVSVSGITGNTLGAANIGGYDAWAASLSTVPEPTSATLLLGSGALLLLRRRAGR